MTENPIEQTPASEQTRPAGLGEWDTEVATDLDPQAAAQLVDVEVQREIRRQVRRLARQAVANDLTPDVVDDLQAHAATASHTELTTDPHETEPPELHYGSVDEFVRGVVLPTFHRRVKPGSEHRWAADWWRHTEAIVRLEAMWRSWEHLRLDPATGMSVWLRDHADPQLAALMDPDGPFAASTDSNRLGEPLPYTPPPPGLFPDVRTQQDPA